MSRELKQIIFDTWNEYSIVTVDRRNGRDHVKITKSVFLSRVGELTFPDINVEYFNKRNNEMVRITRHISTKTVREMRELIFSKLGFYVSIGSFLASKPFYILNPTEREKQSCMCLLCLNLRLRFEELQKHLVEQINSDTEAAFSLRKCLSKKS